MEYKDFLYSMYNQELVDKAYELSKEIYKKSDFESDINFYNAVTKFGVDSEDEKKRMYNRIYEKITYAFLTGATHAVKSGMDTTNLNPSEISFSYFRKNVDFAVFFDYSDNDFSTSIEAAAKAYCDEFNRILGQIDMYQDYSSLSMLNSYIKDFQELCKVSTIKEIMKCGFMADRLSECSNTAVYCGKVPNYEDAVLESKENVLYIPWDGERQMWKKVEGEYGSEYVESEKFNRFAAGTRKEIESILKKYGEPEAGWNDDFPVWCNAEVVILYMKNGYLTYVIR